MIRNIRLRLSSWFALRWLSSTERIVISFEKKLKETQYLLRKRYRQLTSLQRRLELISETLVEDLEEAQTLQKQYEETVSSLREENRIYSNVTIPTLMTEHARILQCLKAELSIAVRHQVMATPDRED